MVLADINVAAAETVVALIKERSPNAKLLAIKTDVGKEEDIKDLVDRTVKEYGRLDVMVC